jgi:hypothetical protein
MGGFEWSLKSLRSLTSLQSLQSLHPPMTTDPSGFLPPHGGYENLISLQKARIVYDGTVFFTRRWLVARGDRTVDQMV